MNLPNKKFALAAIATAMMGFGLPAAAASYSVIALTFEGPTDSSHATVRVSDYYQGGTSKDLSGTNAPVVSGTAENFGVNFDSGALALDSLDLPGGEGNFNTRTGPVGLAGMGDSALVFDVPNFDDTISTLANVAAGFNDYLSFLYANVESGVQVTVYGGVGGTGAVLASETFGTTTPCADGSYCEWNALSLSFLGQVGRSVVFSGVNETTLVDNLTFGSASPTDTSILAAGPVEPPVLPPVPAIPEPSTYALMALGLAGLGFAARRRKAA